MCKYKLETKNGLKFIFAIDMLKSVYARVIEIYFIA